MKFEKSNIFERRELIGHKDLKSDANTYLSSFTGFSTFKDLGAFIQTFPSNKIEAPFYPPFIVVYKFLPQSFWEGNYHISYFYYIFVLCICQR